MSTESFIPYLQICSFRFYVTYSRNYLNLNQGLFGVASFRIKVPSFLFVDIEKQSGHLFPDALLVEPDDVFPATSTGRLKKKKKKKNQNLLYFPGRFTQLLEDRESYRFS